jgi:hypothetical protein
VKKLTGNCSELAYDFLTLAVTRRDMTATWQGGEMESIADRLRQWWVGEHVQHESSREVVFLGLAHRHIGPRIGRAQRRSTSAIITAGS